MPQKEFINIIEFFKPKLDEYIRTSPHDMLSYFDLTTAIALYWFAKKKVDWAIIEVGCGGRLDSTNVIPHKDIAVITNVGLDHTDILGDTKEKIAYEKAGVVTKGCEVFSTEKNKKVLRVIEDECKKKKACLSHITYHISHITTTTEATSFHHNDRVYTLSCLGTHQTKNAALAIDIAHTLNIPEQPIKRGLKKTKQPLRMEIVSKKPLIILDSAHNPDKIKTTVDTALQLYSSTTIHLLIGFSDNKDIAQLLKQLSRLRPKSIACTRNTVNLFRKVADPKKLAETCKNIIPESNIDMFLDPKEAFSWSRKQQKTGDVLLITGSIFLSGQFRR